MTPLGYPAAEGSARKRKDVSEFVFYERHGKKEWDILRGFKLVSEMSNDKFESSNEFKN